MLGKYSTISNTRLATTHIYAMRTYFSPWQTSTANVTKSFLRKPVHPLRLNIGTLQNLASCFHTSRFKSITSIHCQRPLQKHVNNHIDNVNGVTFVTRKHMFLQGPIFSFSLQTVTSSQDLTLLNVKEADSGRYVCMAEYDTIKVFSHFAELDVLGK